MKRHGCAVLVTVRSKDSSRRVSFSENKPPLPFPRDALRTYAESGFRDLKRDQDKALRARRIAPWRKHYGWS